MDLNFKIEEPRLTSTVEASLFGCCPENPDNTEALQAALDYMAGHPGTRLTFSQAVYHFASEKQIFANDITDGMMDGCGAVLIWSEKGYFSVNHVCRFSVENLYIDWDWENRYRLADMIRVVKADEEMVEFEHFEVSEVQKNVWKSVNQYDPVDLTPGVEDGKEYEINYFQPCVRSIEYPGGNHSIVHHDGLLQDMAPGEVYCLRYEMYGTNAFVVRESQHVTFRNVTVWSVPGMGWIITSATKYTHFDHCIVEKKPGRNANISATADSMHIGNSGGYVIVENCDFSFAGDDAINIHDNVGLITERLDARTYIVQKRLVCTESDTIGLLRDDILDVDFRALVEKIEDVPENDRLQKITFDRDLPEGCKENWVTYNLRFSTMNYIFRNNYFHENRARGLLLGASHGLVENNVLYKTQGSAIWTVVDIEPRWSEGIGVQDLTIRNNKFINCDVNHWASCVYLRTLIPTGDSPSPVFRDILFEDNLFEDCSGFAMSFRSCGNITVRNNTFKLTHPRKTELPERGAVEIEKSSGIVFEDNTIVKTPYYRGPLTRNRYPHANKGIIRCTLDREPLTIYTDDLDAYKVSGTRLEKNS